MPCQGSADIHWGKMYRAQVSTAATITRLLRILTHGCILRLVVRSLYWTLDLYGMASDSGIQDHVFPVFM